MKRKRKLLPTKPEHLTILKRVCKILLVSILIFLFIIIAIFGILHNGPSENRDIYFDHESGFYDNDLELKLSTKGLILPGLTSIQYNLNGDNLTHSSTLYSEPIKLNIPEKGYQLYTITAAFCYANTKCSTPHTSTYVLGKNLKTDVDLDIININSAYDNLYSYETGILVKGKTYDQRQAENPEAEYIGGNYNQRTEDWIRDSHVTMFNPNGKILFDKDLGIQVSGGTSAALDLKSLKLVGNKKYGYSKIPFDFGNGISQYNSIKLSSGGQDQDAGNIRSGITSKLAEESNFSGVSNTKRVVVFLNGNFYGIFNAQESFSDSNLAKIFDLPSGNFIEKIKDSETRAMEKASLYELFWSDLDDPRNRSALEDQVDMDNYLTYYALQILWNNTDWPANNFEMWRYTGNENSANTYTDGRWRFLIYDVDFAYQDEDSAHHLSYDWLEALMDDEHRATNSTFRNVITSDFYRAKFTDILKSLIDGPFNTQNVLNVINEEADKINHQMELWSSNEQYESWKEQIQLIKEIASKRNDIIRADMLEFFDIEL